MTIQKIISGNSYKKDTMVVNAYPTGQFQKINGAIDTPATPVCDRNPVKRAYASISSSGNNTLITAVSGKKIAIVGYKIFTNGAVNMYFTTGTTRIGPTMYADAAGWGVACSLSEDNETYLETNSGELLGMNLSSAVAVDVEIQYIEK